MSKVKVKTKEEIFQDDSFILALENAGGVMVDFKSFGQITLKDAISFYFKQDYTKFSPGELTKSKAELKELRKHIPKSLKDIYTTILSRINNIKRGYDKIQTETGTIILPGPTISTKYSLNGRKITDIKTEETAVINQEKINEVTKHLRTTEAHYILDSIGVYIQNHVTNPEQSKLKKVTASDGTIYFLLTDTFNSFCKCSGIHGEMRKRVQESIINNKLATITIPVTHPETKKEHLIDKFFIQYESGIRKKAGAGIKKSGEQYEQKDIVLRINGEVLAFLDKMHLIKTGKAKGKIIGEYWENITFFSKEISRAIERLKEMEGYSGNPKLQRLNLCINVHGPVMHELVEYVFYRWKRGRKALNTEYMEISYQDFINKAGAPEYKKEIQKREFLLIAVKMIVDWIREQNKAVTLPGSGAIKSESDSLKIWKETTGSREAFSAKK